MNVNSRTVTVCHLRTEIRSSDKSRSIESGISFMEGIFGGETSLPEIQLENHLLRFYKDCDKFQVEVAENEETYSEARALEAGRPGRRWLGGSAPRPASSWRRTSSGWSGTSAGQG